MSSGFVKVYGSILTSSIWMEDAPTRITWLTLLVMADQNGFVEASVLGIAHQARVTPDQCRAALGCFQRPDPDSKDPENEGRRIVKVDGGFIILNHQKYRERQTPAQVRTAERTRRWRERLSAKEHATVTRDACDAENVTCDACDGVRRAEAEAEADTEVLDKNQRSDSYLLSPEVPKLKSEKPFADWLMDEWNRLAPPVGLPRWVIMSTPRRKRATALGKQFPDRESWTRVITAIVKSKFCLGVNERRWKADPEFLMRDDTYARALEGAITRWGASGSTNARPADVRQQVEAGSVQTVARRLQRILDEES
jgi:hypothetical protein